MTVQALADGLVSKLRMRPMGDYQMAWVNGVVGPEGEIGLLPELLPADAIAADEDAEDVHGGIFIGTGAVAHRLPASNLMGVLDTYCPSSNHTHAMKMRGKSKSRRQHNEPICTLMMLFLRKGMPFGPIS